MSPSFTADVALRLQQLIAGWRGAERSQPLSILHDECLNAAGPGGRHLLPAYLLPVRNLDETNLRAALQKANGRVRGTDVRFRVRVAGRFDAVLVPFGPGGELPERWLLAIEEHLPIRDQVALYGHALGHLLLNREQAQLGQLPPLDPRDGHAHRDTLAELRLDEAVRQRVDRRVLETYPLLAALLMEREELPAALDVATSDLRQRLAHDGWRGVVFVTSPYVFTHGRVYIRGTTAQHGKKLRVDALLRGAASLPIAAVQTIHAGQTREEVSHRLIEYAHRRLAVPFAYLLDEDGTIVEFDWTAGEEPHLTILSNFPSRDMLLKRWMEALGLSDHLAKEALIHPYQLGQMPRYYQEIAINRAVIAVLQAKRQARSSRILLTLATGTGKTKVAFQLLWKLKRVRAIRNILFITDRDYLLGQAMDNEFAPFGDARTRILGEARTSRDVVFATYQAIADTKERLGLYRIFPRDFFDVIIIDECHRGSAQEDSKWRSILEHFERAVQVGLTATPLSNKTVQTDDYFGEPIYTYSLRTGINDGFLSPYRVRYVLMGEARQQEQHQEAHPTPIPSGTPSPTLTGEDDFDPEASAIGQEIIKQTVVAMLARTEIIAQHLAAYLRQTGPLAKTIVFCVNQDHAERMRAALEHACSEHVMRYTGYIERIVSDEGIEGKRALGHFSTPEDRTPVIVTTSRLLSTGVDIPTCKNIVLARPVGSLVEFKQIIGRGSRLHEPDKTWFTIIDYAGAIKLFFDPSFDGDPELVEVEPLVPQPQQTIDAVTPEQETGNQATMADALAAETALPSPDHVSSVENVPPIAAGKGTMAENTFAGEEIQPATSATPIKNIVKEIGKLYPSSPEAEQNTAPANLPVPLTPLTAANEDNSQEERERPPVLVPATPQVVKRTHSGQTIGVIGEYVYDLGPDGKTLRLHSSYRDFASSALQRLVNRPGDLQERWLHKEQRKALQDALEEEGVDLPVLAAALHLPGVDPLDLLQHIAFGRQPLTRSERVERLYREHADFFDHYQSGAGDILRKVLEKYEAGEAQDVSDPELLKVPPLSESGTFIELAKPFGGGTNVRAALKALQELLYSA